MYTQTIAFSAGGTDVYQQDVIVHRSEGTGYEAAEGDLLVWHVYVGDRCKSDYGDVRFTDASGNALAYYLWPDHDAESARFTVRLEDADVAGSVTIHYGNSSARTESNGDATYLFFDHFDGTALDGAKWTNSGSGGEVTVAGGEAILRAVAGGPNRYITSKTSFASLGDISVEVKARHNPSGSTRAGVSIAAGRGDRSLYGAGVYGASFERSYTVGHGNMGQYWYADSTRMSSTVAAENDNVFRFDIYQSGARADYYANGVLAHQGKTIDFNSFPYVELYIATWDGSNNPRLHVDYVVVRAYSSTPPAATAFSGEKRIGGVSTGVALGSANMMVI